MGGLNVSYEALFDQSYERVLKATVKERDFFEAFYEHFLASSEDVREKFKHTDMSIQKKMLKKSFYSLLVFYASNSADDYLNKMVEKHNNRQVNIPNAMYDLWLECLIMTLREFDSQCNPEVELAWRLVLSGGITYMKFKHC